MRRAAAFLALFTATSPAFAQDAGPLTVELNAAVEGSDGCTLSFLITNGGEADIGKAVFETVLFDTEGQVERLTLFDFGELPAGRPRVRQFTLSDTTCSGLSRLLVNGVTTCEAPIEGACTEGLRLTSRTDIEIIG
ncbi:hypothetical protein JSE7799_02005 [Jannaschia seosinensis]|uniref:Tat pathway signal sequence domain protein n=1 Tax=Jannaschia seosinensis TaxID=313367 RepID=A0A0M7BA71_9RHOB|nr:hypothetical protein [Jannaschia seosinensis]CUH39281.1 hypothetical protein JSE7799_02005 [Jannaschia seosinensis]